MSDKEKELNDLKKMRLSTEEAAIYLDVKPDTVRLWRQGSRGPKYYKYPTGGKVFYLKKDLDKWLGISDELAK